MSEQLPARNLPTSNNVVVLVDLPNFKREAAYKTEKCHLRDVFKACPSETSSFNFSGRIRLASDGKNYF